MSTLHALGNPRNETVFVSIALVLPKQNQKRGNGGEICSEKRKDHPSKPLSSALHPQSQQKWRIGLSPSYPSRVCFNGKLGFRTPIRALQETSFEPVTSNKEGGDSPNWKVKMLYDGECPLCMREVNMLRERNKRFGTIKFVDISCDDYSAAENQDLDYPTAMGRIHAILSDGSVVMDVEAFRKLYEAVGLGWVYAITKYEPIAAIANSLYGFWAKYRLQITGRPALEEVIEAKLKKKEEAFHSKDSCKM
ncbi:hypothetical protein V2J09_000747 [Rumex salicifolius]